MPKDEEILFKTEDPRGYQISLSREQYYNHIISSEDHNAHTEFTPDEIKDCIESPQIIWQSKRIPTSDLYFGKTSATYPNLFLRTAVAINEENRTGDVTTAHLTKSISGGKDGGIKHVGYKSKL